MKDPKSIDEVKASDLPAALYLNQRLVFDMLASFEGGFSQLQNIQSSTAASDAGEQKGNASLGVTNVFALLGVSLGGSLSRSSNETDSRTISEQRVHTPTSLFANLRQHLANRRLLKTVNSHEGLGSISTGDFVEFKVPLRRSPLVEVLKGFQEFMPIAAAFSDTNVKSGAPQKSASQAKPQFEKQVAVMLKAVTAEGSEDLIGDWPSGVRFVLTTEEQYFVDPTLNNLADGEFTVLGKVTRIVKDDSEPAISLLRKTPLGLFNDELVSTLTKAFEGLAQSGVRVPGIETRIQGPAAQVIPIAIFA